MLLNPYFGKTAIKLPFTVLPNNTSSGYTVSYESLTDRYDIYSFALYGEVLNSVFTSSSTTWFMSGTHVLTGIKGVVDPFSITTYFDSAYTSRTMRISRVYPIYVIAVLRSDNTKRIVFKQTIVASSDRDPPTNLNINVSSFLGSKGATTFTVPITSWSVQEYNHVSVFVIPALSNSDGAFPADPATVSAPYVVTDSGTTFSSLGDQLITTVSRSDGSISTYYDSGSSSWQPITRNTYYFRLMVKDGAGNVRHSTTGGVQVGDFVDPTFTNPGFTISNIPGSTPFNTDNNYIANVSWNASDWNTYKIYFVVQESSDSTSYNTPWSVGNMSDYNFVNNLTDGSSNSIQITRYYKNGQWFTFQRNTYKIKMYIRDAGPNVTEVTGKNITSGATGTIVSFLVGDYDPPVFSSVSTVSRSDPIVSGSTYYCTVSTSCSSYDSNNNHRVYFFLFYQDNDGSISLTDGEAYTIVTSGNYSGVNALYRYVSTDYGEGTQPSTISNIRGYIYNKASVAGKEFVGGRTYNAYFVAADRMGNYRVHNGGGVYVPYLTNPVITLTAPSSRTASNGSYTPISLTVSGLESGRNIKLWTYSYYSASTVNVTTIQTGTLHNGITNQSINHPFSFMPEGLTLYFYWYAEDSTYSSMNASNANSPATGRTVPTLNIPWALPTVTIAKVAEYKSTFSYKVIGVEETSSEFRLIYGVGSAVMYDSLGYGTLIGTNQYQRVTDTVSGVSYAAYSVIERPIVFARSRQTNASSVSMNSADTVIQFSNEGVGVGATIGTMTFSNITFNSFILNIPFTLSSGFTAVARIQGVMGTLQPIVSDLTTSPTALSFSSLSAGTSYTANVYVYGYYRNYESSPLLQVDTSQVSSAYPTTTVTTLGTLIFVSKSTDTGARTFTVTTSINVPTTDTTYRELVVTSSNNANNTSTTGYVSKGGSNQGVTIDMNDNKFINGGTFNWVLNARMSDNSTPTNPSQVTSASNGTFELPYISSVLTASYVSVNNSTRTLVVSSSVTLRTSTRVLHVSSNGTSTSIKSSTASNVAVGSSSLEITLTDSNFVDGGTWTWYVAATDSNNVATNPASTALTNTFTLTAVASTLSASLKSVDNTSRILTLDTNVTLRAYIVQIIVKSADGNTTLQTGTYSTTYTSGAQTPSITLTGSTLDAGGTGFRWEANAKVQINGTETALPVQTGTFDIATSDITPPTTTITSVTPGDGSLTIVGTSVDANSTHKVHIFTSLTTVTVTSSTYGFSSTPSNTYTSSQANANTSIAFNQSITTSLGGAMANGTSYYVYVVGADSRNFLSIQPLTATQYTTLGVLTLGTVAFDATARTLSVTTNINSIGSTTRQLTVSTPTNAIAYRTTQTSSTGNHTFAVNLDNQTAFDNGGTITFDVEGSLLSNNLFTNPRYVYSSGTYILPEKFRIKNLKALKATNNVGLIYRYLKHDKNRSDFGSNTFITKNLTAFLWFYYDNSTGSHENGVMISFAIKQPSDHSLSLGLVIKRSGTQFSIGDSDSYTFNAKFNEWQYVCFGIENNMLRYVIVNGNTITTNANINIMNKTGNGTMMFGAGLQGVNSLSPDGYNMKGYLSDIGIWGSYVALSTAVNFYSSTGPVEVKTTYSPSMYIEFDPSRVFRNGTTFYSIIGYSSITNATCSYCAPFLDTNANYGGQPDLTTDIVIF